MRNERYSGDKGRGEVKEREIERGYIGYSCDMRKMRYERIDHGERDIVIEQER